LLSKDGHVSTPAYLLSAGLLLLSAGTAILAARRPFGRSQSTSARTEAPSEDYFNSISLHRRQLNDKLRQLVNDAETAAAKLLVEPMDKAIDIFSEDFQQLKEAEDAFWQQLREAVYEQLERLEEYHRGESKQVELNNRLQELQMERELIQREANEQSKRIEELKDRWRIWLQDRKLPAHLTPESLPELLGMAEQGQTVLRQRQRVLERSHILSSAIQEFEQDAERLMIAYPAPVFAGTRRDAVQAVQWFYRESARQSDVKEEAIRLDHELVKAESNVEEAINELKCIENRIAALFQEAQVDSDQMLEQRIIIDERCTILRKEAREIQFRLESGRDSEAQAQLYEMLRSSDEASLNSMLIEQKLKLSAEEDLRSELLDKRGRLTQELERLRREAELEDQGQRLRELESKLELFMERYAILAISDHLIVQTKAVYEDEKQPAVLQRASRFFQQMTNGAYIRIIAPGDSKSLLAETQDRRMLSSVFLSRGTQEQLYLAMRFALSDAAAPEHPLPLLLDDLFVHFDEQRFVQTLPVLEEMARKRQIFLFTCHRHVAQTIASGIPSARILKLGTVE